MAAAAANSLPDCMPLAEAAALIWLGLAVPTGADAHGSCAIAREHPVMLLTAAVRQSQEMPLDSTVRHRWRNPGLAYWDTAAGTSKMLKILRKKKTVYAQT